MASCGLADVYVRHAMALADPDLPPDQWALGGVGRAAAKELAARLRLARPVAAVVSSPSPKAAATAAPLAARLGVEVHLDDRLVEASRPWVGDDYRAEVHHYLAGDVPPGWEDRTAVAARVSAAVDDARRHAGDDAALVVVSHGLALSLHLEAVLPAGFDAGGFWARLAFPDAWSVDRRDLVLDRFRP